MATLFEQARRVVVITGAGISAPSGMPLYRGPGGFLDEDLALKSHADRYRYHLDELWDVWGEIARQAQDAEPNAAHRALAHWEQLLDENGGHLEVITQNVDGLHQRAGSRAVTEMHGSILRTRPVGTDDSHVSTATSKRGIDPHRTSFGSPSVRPDIVLFGEVPRGIPHAHRVVGQADLVLFVGTSGLINHVAELLRLANAGPAVTMLLNLEPWDERTTALTGNFDITTLDDALELEVLVPTS